MGALVAGPSLDVVDRCVYFISKADNSGVYTINRYRYVNGTYATLAQVRGSMADNSLQDVISMTFDSVGGKLYWANDRGPKVGLFVRSPKSNLTLTLTLTRTRTRTRTLTLTLTLGWVIFVKRQRQRPQRPPVQPNPNPNPKR